MHRSNPFTAAFAGFVLTCFTLAPTPSHAREATAPVQLVRAGDSQLSCDALAAEINQLAGADQPVQIAAVQPATKKKKGGFLRVLSRAAPFLGPIGMLGSGVGAAVASSAVGAAGSLGSAGSAGDAEDMMAQSRAAMQRAMAGPTVEMQRRERLEEMFEAKRC